MRAQKNIFGTYLGKLLVVLGYFRHDNPDDVTGFLCDYHSFV